MWFYRGLECCLYCYCHPLPPHELILVVMSPISIIIDVLLICPFIHSFDTHLFCHLNSDSCCPLIPNCCLRTSQFRQTGVSIPQIMCFFFSYFLVSEKG